MTSIASLRSHIPQQFQQIGRGSKQQQQPTPAPPSQPDPQQQHQEGTVAADHAPLPPPQDNFQPNNAAANTLELVPRGHAMAVVANDSGQTLLTITFASASSDEKAPDLIVLRGDGGGHTEIASAQFHRWTTSKTDVRIHGEHVKVKKEFGSATGLGKVKWEKDGRKAMKLVDNDSGKGKGKGSKEVLARFAGASRKKGAGQFEMVRRGLGREQVEEVVVSCLVERERMRRDGELLQSGLEEGVWELFMASMGFP